MNESTLTYVCDNYRHLVCVPYSVENLHRMAHELGINRCWFHNNGKPHYDLPKTRIEEIKAKCTVVPRAHLASIIMFKDQSLDDFHKTSQPCHSA